MKNIILFLSLALGSLHALPAQASDLTLLHCTLSVEGQGVVSRGHLVLSEVGVFDHVDLGLEPVVQTQGKELRAVITAYVLSTGEKHILAYLTEENLAVATKIYPIDTDVIGLSARVNGRMVYLNCA